jgi:protoporphyrin/coproporphyrin ferrochelatase
VQPNPASRPYDALIVLSFGGPEKPDEVIPFLENVLRGRNVPRERMMEVAEHYYHFGGRSPINDQNRALVAALGDLLARQGPALPVYWGNRNWHPLLADTLRQMARDGVRRALAFATSAFKSYSGCRQYLEDIARARAELGAAAPEIDKLGSFHDRPGFIAACADRLGDAFSRLPVERRRAAHLLFTAHSIPLAMARTSDYESQVRETARLTAAAMGRADGSYQVVWQSRSGPPGQPWLEPDILTALTGLAHSGTGDVVVAPIGFLSDHMEVVYDLDTEAATVASAKGLNLVRAATVGTHPAYLSTIRDLIVEAAGGLRVECRADCCPPPPARPARPA